MLYELALLGDPSATQAREVEALVGQAVRAFGMRLGTHVGWQVRPDAFAPGDETASAAAFFGGPGAPTGNLQALLSRAVPVIPVVSDLSQVQREIPELLRPFNCLAYGVGGAQVVASALLECAALLPRQRRVFVSYKRDEARQAALQLFDAFSSRLFDVFLDTHGIAVGDDVQAVLWHRLCDSDVLVMLDTPTYFESRWTSAEFGRALAKGISVLRVGWPDSTPSARTATASRAELVPGEVDPGTGRLSDAAVNRIWLQLEAVRSQSHAVRTLNLVGSLRHHVARIGGTISGVGSKRAVHIRLADGRHVLAFPTVGVPTSTTLHEAAVSASGHSAAVLFDPVGFHPKWLEHLDWLGRHIGSVRWLKATEAGWALAAWED